MNSVEIIMTEIFARLPDKFRSPAKRSAWIEARGHADVHSFLEGPSFDRAGNLYCVDIPFGRVFKVTPDGEFHLVTEYEGEPNGLKIHKDGRIFIADHALGLLTLNSDTGVVQPFLQRGNSEGFRGLNDLVFASNGDLYFTDQGHSGLEDPGGRVFRLRADGVLECLLKRVPSPNGLVLSCDEKLLFVNVTSANAVWRLPLPKTGEAKKVAVFIYLSGGLGGPDGLAIDEEGGLAVVHAGMGAVWLHNRLGESVFRVNSCAGLRTTNLAYGGADRKSLYITESETGVILKARVPVAGNVMYSHM